jgi:hypothetical protein
MFYNYCRRATAHLQLDIIIIIIIIKLGRHHFHMLSSWLPPHHPTIQRHIF